MNFKLFIRDFIFIFLAVTFIDMVVDLIYYSERRTADVLMDNISSIWTNIAAALIVAVVLSIRKAQRE